MSDRKVDDVEREITRLFSDMTVPASVTRQRLEALKEHIEILLSTLPNDTGDDDG
jgi:hypothetical protein